MRLWKHLKDILFDMKKSLSFFVLISIIISCNDNSDWLYLFDGKTTNGWRGYNSEIMPPGWIVKKGVLTF